MNAKEKVEELRANGIPVYSFSRLGTFHTCEFEYWNTYVEKNKGIDNVYTILGTELHNNIEGIYDGSIDLETFKRNYENKLIELDILDIKFPNEMIGNSWKRDVSHFINNFNKLDTKMAIETLILFQVGNIWLQGYVDAIVPSEKGKPYVNIIDWKTSSKFTGKKLTEAGRQLIMYKLGIEETSNLKVDKVMWNMIKYINVCWKLKNGSVKKKMCNRGKWVKEIKNTLETDMKKLDMPEFELEMLLEKAISDNNINCLPKEIQEKYWLEDCYLEYEVTDERIEEFKQYVIDTVKQIESKGTDQKEWKAVEIDKKNSFYCSVLCGHRKHCPFYKAYLDENADQFEKKKEDKMDFTSLFG